MSKGLRLGDVIRCKYCGQEHEVKDVPGANTDAVKAMLYVACMKPKPGRYHVGSIGGKSNRGPIVRRASTPNP